MFQADSASTLKNMGSWSDLANAMAKSTSSAGKSAAKKNAMQSFEKFKKAAQEKEERVSECM